VRREDGWWFAEASFIGVVRARSLHSAVRRAQELAGDVPVRYQFHTGDAELDRLVIQIQAARAAAQRHMARAKQLTGKVLMLPSGGSVRDVALLVGLSYQRVHQLMRQGSDGERPADDPP
jgi:hypothetical protein